MIEFGKSACSHIGIMEKGGGMKPEQNQGENHTDVPRLLYDVLYSTGTGQA